MLQRPTIYAANGRNGLGFPMALNRDSSHAGGFGARALPNIGEMSPALSFKQPFPSWPDGGPGATFVAPLYVCMCALYLHAACMRAAATCHPCGQRTCLQPCCHTDMFVPFALCPGCNQCVPAPPLKAGPFDNYFKGTRPCPPRAPARPASAPCAALTRPHPYRPQKLVSRPRGALPATLASIRHKLLEFPMCTTTDPLGDPPMAHNSSEGAAAKAATASDSCRVAAHAPMVNVFVYDADGSSSCCTLDSILWIDDDSSSHSCLQSSMGSSSAPFNRQHTPAVAAGSAASQPQARRASEALPLVPPPSYEQALLLPTIERSPCFPQAQADAYLQLVQQRCQAV